MPRLNRDTRLCQLRPTVLFKLRRFFDPDDKWQELAAVIKTKKGEEKYTVEDIKNFEFELKKGRSPTEALIRDWGYDNVSVQSLLKAAAECKRYDVLVWFLVDEMKEMTNEQFWKISEEGFDEYFNSKPVHKEKLLKSPATPVENYTPFESARCDRFPTYASGADAAGDVYEEHNPSVETEPATAVIAGRVNDQKSSQVTLYTYDYLSELTNHWNDLPISEGGHVLGEGGYATVFLGKPPGQREMAVKRLKNKDEAHKQFFHEVDALVMFVHPNIVPLFGVSQDGPDWCIVYEYMEKGSLDDHLFCKDSKPALTSTQRCHIAKGIAQGLTHLHTKNQTPYVHRDIKPENVLLDYDFTAKLGDCGLAHRGPTDPAMTHTTTKAIIGTEYYCAPEYFHGEISVKLDAFSFGMVLYQMLTGQLVYDDLRGEAKRLNDHIDSIFTACGNDAISILVDKKMVGWKKENLEPVFEMASRLTELSKTRRPKVQDVLPEVMEWPQDW